MNENIVIPDANDNNINQDLIKESPRKTEIKPLSPRLIASSPSTITLSLYQRTRIYVENICESIPFMLFMTLITIWALYDDDLRLAVTSKSADKTFEIIISICFFIFLIEIFLQIFYKDGYLNIPKWSPIKGEYQLDTWTRRIQIGSFFFWLDWISTLSLLFEMPWVIGNGLSGNGGTQSAGSAKTARAGRVVRLVRMVRLVRLIKLYKYSSNMNKEGIKQEEKESQVGAAMSDTTNKKVIILVLAMLIIIPLLTVLDPDLSYSAGIQYIGILAYNNMTNPTDYENGLNLAVTTVNNELDILKLTYNAETILQKDSYNELRPVEMYQYDFFTFGYHTYIAYNAKYDSQEEARYSMYTTTFIIVLLMLGTYFFSTDVNRLVIRPIECLVALVRKISVNPLGIEYKMLGEEEGFMKGMETTYLLATIIKIGGLMRVGFGEAGATIIAKNLSESAGGKLNLMGTGTMIHSIFGFCDVRQFTDTTECLQEEVMLFVNRIAHILHSIVVQCSGSANKNIGDAFLLTWKLDDKLSPEEISTLADQALLAFCKALIELSRYQNFICNFSINATARLYKRFPDYNVRIGSGLHVGWAIEGAIGSDRKIDASYLSPHVNNTEYLESSTKQYGVPLLMSEPFYRLLSPAASKYVRQVDRIKRSPLETDVPFGLYTYDSDLLIDWQEFSRKKRLLAKKKHKAPMMAPNKTNFNQMSMRAMDITPQTTATKQHRNTLRNNLRRFSIAIGIPTNNNNNRGGDDDIEISPRSETTDQEAARNFLENEEISLTEAPTIKVKKYALNTWNDDDDLIELRHNVSDSFRSLWSNGIDAYIKGDWQKARDIFHETMLLSSNNDGPSKFLMEIIDEHGGTAPHDWKGYREDY